ncbi:hypothetical protein KIH74_22930 [Kineosporia sp. J2-2]|uniref:Uncharacterized protein n=1 Tax=Kineosporia corallincola TaxID=2835133 RepID=A0ABS5TL35_9ACTN|nr:hypothetical protein [Kineosporia corallincola]MBT0771814.1 hypothetical protein [Kineosporia corallincola]
MRSEAGDVAALSSEVATVKAAGEAGSSAAMARADASMRVANTARAAASEVAARADDLAALASTVKSAMQASIQDRAGLHQQADSLAVQVDALIPSVAGKASAETVSRVVADLSALTSTVGGYSAQVSALATVVASRASQQALDALTSVVGVKAAQAAVDGLNSRVTAAETSLASAVNALAGKASQTAVDGLAGSVSVLQTGLSALAARVATLELRPTVTVRQARDTGLPAIALLASVDRTFTWATPMPSASYSIKPSVEGPAGLGQLTAAVKSQTAAGCVITVKAAVAVAAGQVLDVLAIHST